MVVLQLSYEIYPVVGGTSTLIQYLMEGMMDKNCEIHLVTKTIDVTHPNVIKVGNSYIYTIYCKDAEETNHDLELKTQIRFLRKIKEIVDSGVKFDLIHVHDAMPVDLVPYLKKRFNLPILMSYHINHHILQEQAKIRNDSDLKKNLIAYELEKKGATLCDYFMSASIATKNWLINSYGIKEDIIRVIPYGINLNKYPNGFSNSEVIEKFRNTNKKIVLFAGRFVLQKGIEYLLDAFLEVQKIISDIKIVLIGEGKKKDEIIEKLSVLDKEYFEVIPKIPFDKLAPYYYAADIVVMPSIFEPFGMVCIEAMASKAVIVASKIDGLGEIIRDGYNGYEIPVIENDKFRYIDTDVLKNIIIMALNNSEKNKVIRRNARKFVEENYSAESFAKNMYNAYLEIIEEYNKKRG